MAAGALLTAAALSGGELALFSGRELAEAAGAAVAEAPAPVAPPAARECVLFQCRRLPIEPSEELFTPPTSIWTGAGLLVAIVNGIQAPIRYGVQPFHFTDEGFFQSWTYGGGSDKASHFIISANTAELLYDAYRLNGLSEDPAFALALATAFVGGTVVEIGDGVTPYGFSAQDWTADALGAL